MLKQTEYYQELTQHNLKDRHQVFRLHMKTLRLISHLLKTLQLNHFL